MAFLNRLKNAQKSSTTPDRKQPREPITKKGDNISYAVPEQDDYKNRLRSNPDIQRRLFTEPPPPQAPLHYSRNSEPYQPLDRKSKSPGILRNSRNSKQSSVNQSVRNPNISMMKYTKKPASAAQYKKFMGSSQNVFYQDTFDYKKKLLSKFGSWAIGLIILFLVLVFVLARNSEPFPEDQVPQNGYVRNGVLYCELGYVKEGNQCILDAKLLQKAQKFAMQTLNRLKYEWGNQICSNKQQYIVPSYNIESILHEDNHFIDEQKLTIFHQQVQRFFKDPKNQERYKFQFNAPDVTPTQKKRSFSCQLSLFVGSWRFFVTLAFGILIGIVIYKLTVHYNRKAIARKMYEYLKNKLKYDNLIQISKEKEQLQKFGKMDKDLWALVDAQRVKEAEIGYYEDDNLYWRKL